MWWVLQEGSLPSWGVTVLLINLWQPELFSPCL